MNPPIGARKLAHYYYGDGTELAIFALNRRTYVRDGKCGGYPFIDGKIHPHPLDGTEDSDFDFAYDTLGLYYDLPMPETGWDGDC